MRLVYSHHAGGAMELAAASLGDRPRIEPEDAGRPRKQEYLVPPLDDSPEGPANGVRRWIGIPFSRVVSGPDCDRPTHGDDYCTSYEVLCFP